MADLDADGFEDIVSVHGSDTVYDDKWLLQDLDQEGDLAVIGTRGNSEPYDGVIWLEQLRTQTPRPSFQQARHEDSEQMPLP